MELFDIQNQTVLADTFLDNYPSSPKAYKAPKGLLKKLNPNFRSRRIGKLRNQKRILYSHFGNRGWRDLNVACDRRIVRFYGYDLHRLPFENPIWNDRYLELFEKVDAVITEGPFMKNELVKKGCAEDKIEVLPFGVAQENPKRIREPEPTFKVLIAGSFKEKKGIDTALLACKAFVKRNNHLDFEIHLVGDKVNSTAQDHLFHAQLEKLLNDELLKPKIKTHGFVSRKILGQIALKCDFALLPSQWAADRDCEGGFPVTFLELMATGLPIISTYHCDIPFAVNERNGILCNERDYEALAIAMESMLEPEILASKSRAAIKTVEEFFDWQKLKPLYHQVILGE
jgi:colanic acid/amylovoran biosynthesis glycosyltransferase